MTPILAAVNRYRREVTSFLANVGCRDQRLAISSGESGQVIAHYLRTISPLNAETLAAYPDTGSPSTAPTPTWRRAATRGSTAASQSFETRQCVKPPGVNAHLNPADAPLFPGNLFDRIKLYAFGNTLDTADPAYPKPACVQQGLQQSIGAIPELTYYPHVYQNRRG